MASNKLYDRKARVVVNTQVIEDLRIQFKVKRTLKKEPSTCEVCITNLNEESRALLQQKHDKLILEAGYKDTIAQLFSGDSRFVDQKREEADWVTKIQCGDGERAYQYRRISKSFAPGTRVSDVVAAVAQAMGLTVTGLDKVQGLTEQFTQGYTSYGKASQELDSLLRGRGLEWSIQSGQLQILSEGGTTQDRVILLTSKPDNTGLIGSPEHGNPEKDVPVSPDQFVVVGQKKQGPPILKVKALLQPGFYPGRKLQLKSESEDGVFRIQTVTHTGDTHGDAWYSELEVLSTT